MHSKHYAGTVATKMHSNTSPSLTWTFNSKIIFLNVMISWGGINATLALSRGEKQIRIERLLVQTLSGVWLIMESQV